MQYNQIDNIIAQQQFPNKFYDLLSLLKNDTDTGSLANVERSESDDILGSEKYPGEMLLTFGITNLLPEEADRLALYYKSIYGDSYKARSGGLEDDDIYVSDRIIKYGRCRIADDIIGSNTSEHHESTSYIHVKLLRGREIDVYAGQVQFFFEHKVKVNTDNIFEEKTHYLCYVRWYNLSNNRFHFSPENNQNLCNVEIWEPTFYREGRNCIISTNKILSRFILAPVTIGHGAQKRDLIAAIPLNKFFQ
jgi:hypothetical protein